MNSNTRIAKDKAKLVKARHLYPDNSDVPMFKVFVFPLIELIDLN